MAFGIKTTIDETKKTGFEELEIKKPEKKDEEIKEKKEVKDTPPATKKEDTPPVKEPTVKKDTPPAKEGTPPTALTDDQIKEYFKSKGREVSNVEDLFEEKEPTVKEVEKIVNPYEGLLDDEDEAYFKFKKETNGRTRKEWEYLKEDISAKPALELAREKVRQDTGIKLSNEKADAYLEKKLGIDLSEPQLETNDEIELNAFAKPFKDKLIADQEKYRTPLEKAKVQKVPQKQVEMVELTNGQKIPKEQYDNLVEKRNEYLDNIKEAVNSVTATEVKMTIDDNGEKRELNFNYEYSKEDKHSMLSDASDVDATIKNRYQTKDGFDHKGLTEALWWGQKENQQKVIVAAMQQARAEAIEEMIANDNNANFSRDSLQTKKKPDDGYGSLTGKSDSNEFGVKFSLKKG